jgi:hypothetical protein
MEVCDWSAHLLLCCSCATTVTHMELHPRLLRKRACPADADISQAEPLLILKHACITCRHLHLLPGVRFWLVNSQLVCIFVPQRRDSCQTPASDCGLISALYATCRLDRPENQSLKPFFKKLTQAKEEIDARNERQGTARQVPLREIAPGDLLPLNERSGLCSVHHAR